MIIRGEKEIRFLDEADRQRYIVEESGVGHVLRFWLFDAMVDSRTRQNHRVLDGGIAPTDWPGWMQCAPPLGDGCRCTLIAIGARRARKLLACGGRYFDLTAGVPAGAGMDAGYARPAHSIYNRARS